MTAEKLLIGYSRVLMNPDESIPIGGFMNDRERYSKAITQDICSTCVALTDWQGHTLLLIATDLLEGHDAVFQSAREAICAATGVPEEQILVAASHSHSAPGLNEVSAPEIQRYIPKVIAWVCQSAVEALADRKESEVYVGSLETHNMNFVKHYKAQDNQTGAISYIGDQFGTSAGKTILEHATEVDPTMHLVRFVRDGGKDVVLCNFRGHPHFTCGGKKYDLSSDYIGTFRQALEAMTDCHAVYFQGACGNLNTSTRIPEERRFTKVRSYGTALAAYALEGLDTCMRKIVPGTVRNKQITLYGPINHAFDHLYERAVEVWKEWNIDFDRERVGILGEQYGIRSPYHANAIILNYHRTHDDGKLVLNAAAIGDELALVTFPGELFDILSADTEARSPFDTTLLLGYCHHEIEYLPAKIAYEYTSYETDVTRFACGTGELVADTYVQMLKELK